MNSPILKSRKNKEIQNYKGNLKNDKNTSIIHAANIKKKLDDANEKDSIRMMMREFNKNKGVYKINSNTNDKKDDAKLNIQCSNSKNKLINNNNVEEVEEIKEQVASHQILAVDSAGTIDKTEDGKK
ncbi:hypothetical protein PMALA_071920 [Plasmodium malariae]|uniref:Uncharacterized protein n=1 Tax=Plasmodium malariae TaxID=5858 RepID=A0A1A8X519_PLAMA|nr:hypothetical protein PMALA_071920 [Plasmodium malariae]